MEVRVSFLTLYTLRCTWLEKVTQTADWLRCKFLTSPLKGTLSAPGSPICPFTLLFSLSSVSYILYPSSPQTSKTFSSCPLLTDDLASYFSKNIEVLRKETPTDSHSHFHQPDDICAHICRLPSCYYRWWFKNTSHRFFDIQRIFKKGNLNFLPLTRTPF